MTENRQSTVGPVEIMGKLYFNEDSEMLALLDSAEINGEIAQHVYDLRESVQRTREEFAEIVGLFPSDIEDLEESAYEDNPLAVLAQIEKAFLKFFEPWRKPAKTLYANALLNTTITGFRFLYFRYHSGRTVPLEGLAPLPTVGTGAIDSRQPDTDALVREQEKGWHRCQPSVQLLLSELAPWEHSLGITRNKLQIFARAGITEWCNLDGNFYITFTGDANEHIRAIDVHKQSICAFMQYLRTGERTALKQWRQDIGIQEEHRYISELEEALRDRTFAEFPDTEQLVMHLVRFVKRLS